MKVNQKKVKALLRDCRKGLSLLNAKKLGYTTRQIEEADKIITKQTQKEMNA